MESPLGLGDRLQEIVAKAKDGKELFELMLPLPPADKVELFQYAADDQTWVAEKGGDDYMSLMIPYLTEANIKNTLSKELLQIAAESLQANIRFLFYYMPEDIGFIVQNYRFPANSLLFRFIGGEYFSNLIDDYVITRGQKEVELKGVKIRVFQYLKEFVYSGAMEDLWKEEPKIILSVQRKGNKWRMKALSDTAFRTFKNYISKEVLFKRLIAAFEEKNIHMTEELLVELEKEDLGFQLQIRDAGFTLTLKKLDEEIEKMLDAFSPFVYTLHVPQRGIEEESLKKLLRKCQRLESLDLSNFKECADPIELIQALPRGLHILTLCALSWVTDPVVEALIQHIPKLSSLDLSGCDNFQITLLSELSRLKNLETLRLAYLRINESVLSIVAPLWRTVRDLDLSYCPVDDKALLVIIRNLYELRELNLCGCRNVTPEGVLQLAVCRGLRKLDLRAIPSLPPDFKTRHSFRFFNVDMVM